MNVIFYSLPFNAGIFKYYVEHLRDCMLERQSTATDSKTAARPVITALYSKFNAFELERICGTESAKDMLSKHNKVSIVEY